MGILLGTAMFAKFGAQNEKVYRYVNVSEKPLKCRIELCHCTAGAFRRGYNISYLLFRI